jgi:hypothetical protein
MVILVAAACGGRTPLDLFASSADGHDAGGGSTMEAGEDTSSPHPGVDASLDAAPDAKPDAGPLPLILPCDHPAGLQPGSPWPIAGRCPGRAGYTGAVGPSSASTLWTTPAQQGLLETEIVIAADGTVYGYGDVQGVMAVRRDGTLRWSQTIPVAIIPDSGLPSWFPDAYTSMAIGADGTLYAWNGDLTALRPDGSIAWTSEVTSFPNRLPEYSLTFQISVGPEGTIYVVDAPPGGPGNLFAVDTSGNTRWKTSLGGTNVPFCSPSVGAAGRVYLETIDATGSTSLVAFSPAGDALWSHAVGSANPSPNPTQIGDLPVVVGPDGTLYAACGPPGGQAVGSLCSFSAAGVPQTMFAVDGYGSLVMASSGETLYVRTSAGIQAFAADGTLLWSIGAGGNEPPIVDGDGALFTSRNRNDMVAISPSGAVTTVASGGTPLAMGADGTLYWVNLMIGEGAASTLVAVGP